MKSGKILLILLILAFGLFAGCKGKSEKKKQWEKQEVVTHELAEDAFSSAFNPHDSLYQVFIGTWKSVKFDIWIKFKNDGTYAMGKGKKVKSEKLKWKINKESRNLTLQTKRKIKEYPYAFEGDILIIQQDGGEFRYIKIQKLTD